MADAKEAESQDRPAKFRITVVTQHRYTFDTEAATGRQIKEKADIPAGYALYRRVRGGNEPIRDDESVELHHGDHFFARPRSHDP